jgi:hypothetical protein
VIGLEAAAVELGVAIVSAVCKIWLRDTPVLPELLDSGSGLIKSSYNNRIEHRKLRRFIDECVEIVALRVMNINILEREYTQLPDNEREACILSLRDTFQ